MKKIKLIKGKRYIIAANTHAEYVYTDKEIDADYFKDAKGQYTDCWRHNNDGFIGFTSGLTTQLYTP